MNPVQVLIAEQHGGKTGQSDHDVKENPMATSYAEIVSEAMQMPKALRAQLADVLLGSLDDEDEIKAVWGDEIEHRVREIDSGEVKLIPGEQVMNELRSLLR